MKYGFVRMAAITPEIRVADVDYNCRKICAYMDEAADENIKIAVFPELCITGYTCQDLFYQDELLEKAKKALICIAGHSRSLDGLYFVGLPLSIAG